jgi:N-methylhydantoinase A
VVPPSPGVFSALGLLFSDTEHEVVRTLMLRGDEISATALDAAYAEIEGETTSFLSCTAGAVSRYADVRYAGQAYELSIAVPPGAIDVESLVADFVAEHVRTYGHGSADDPVDVVSIRVLARIERTRRSCTTRSAIRALPRTRARGSPTSARRRADRDGRSATGPACSPVTAGPLLVDEGLTVVPPGCLTRLDQYGNIEVELVV